LLKGVELNPNGGLDDYAKIYTGDWALAHVTHILSGWDGLGKGAVILSIKLITFGTADNWKQFKNIKDHLINESV
jgi:hypothetical protein